MHLKVEDGGITMRRFWHWHDANHGSWYNTEPRTWTAQFGGVSAYDVVYAWADDRPFDAAKCGVKLTPYVHKGIGYTYGLSINGRIYGSPTSADSVTDITPMVSCGYNCGAGFPVLERAH
jgi:hypothetical protein